MLTQTRIVSSDLDAAKRFYAAMARPLGLSIIEAEEDGFVLKRPADGAGPVIQVKAVQARRDGEIAPAHVEIEAPDDFTVRAVYRAAMEAGGRQLGYPAPQPTAGYSYYATKIADPDGNCIECGWRH